MSLGHYIIVPAALASLLSIVPSNAQAQTAQAQKQSTAKPRQSTSTVDRYGSLYITIGTTDADGTKSSQVVRALHIPALGLVGGKDAEHGAPVIRLTSQRTCFEGNYRPDGKTESSGIAVRVAPGTTDAKPGTREGLIYLVDKCITPEISSAFVGDRPYRTATFDVTGVGDSRITPGGKLRTDSLKVIYVGVRDNSDLAKKIAELSKYESQASDLAKQLMDYQTKLSQAEDTIKSLTEQAGRDKEKSKSLEDRTKQLEAERQGFESQLAELAELNKQYSNRLEALLRELGSERFLVFAHYGRGNLNNELGQGLNVALQTRGVSLEGAFNSNRLFLDILANLESGDGNIDYNGQPSGNMGLTRNFFRAIAQYSAFRNGNTSVGISGLYRNDGITQRGYLLDPRNPGDPNRRIALAGSGNVSEALIGGFAGFDNGDNRITFAGHWGTSFGVSEERGRREIEERRGRELNFSLSGLTENEYLAVLFGVDFTRFKGREGYYPNPSNPYKTSGTDIHARVSAAFTKGFKGFKPSVGVEFDQMGPNDNTRFMFGFGRIFGPKIRKDAVYK